MMDKISPQRRSENMRLIRSRDTKPELLVRSLVRQLGFRYRIQSRLPGKPDLVFTKKKRAIFVNGCFWHQHRNKRCFDSRIPKSNIDFWSPKLDKNVKRDKDNIKQLMKDGWCVLTIWECQLKNPRRVSARIGKFLSY